MTFYLPTTETTPEIEANPGLDRGLSGFWRDMGASVSKAALENDANFRRNREITRERDDVAFTAAEKIGIDRIRAYGEENGHFDHIRKPPENLERAFTEYGNEMSQWVLDIARQDAKENPDAWSGVDLTDEGMEARAAERLQAEHRDLEATIAMSPGHGGGMEFLGGMVGTTFDIKNLPFLAMGGGGGSIFRTMGREAAINMGAETAFLPSQFKMAETLDIPEPDVAQQLAMAAGAGALLGGAFDALGRGYRYVRDRGRLPAGTPVNEALLVDEIEDILLSDTPDPVARAVNRVIREPSVVNPDRPPLSAYAEDGDLVPLEPDADIREEQRQELITGMEEQLAEAKAADSTAKSPLIDELAKKPTKTQSGPTNQIHPEGKFAQTMRAMGITPKTRPGLYSRNGRRDFDTLVASEWEEMFPGITVASRSDDPDLNGYLDIDGFAEVVERSARGDYGWLTPRATVDLLERQLDDIKSGRTDPFEQPLDVDVDPHIAAPDRALTDEDMLWRHREVESVVDSVLTHMGFLDSNGRLQGMTDFERAEIVDTLHRSGGDVEIAVENMANREIRYAEEPETPEAPDGRPDRPGASGAGQPEGVRGEEGRGAARDGDGAEGSGRQTETTAAGQQYLIDDVEPLTVADRLEAMQARPLDGGDAPADFGLFDTGARSQTDMFDDVMAPETQRLEDVAENDMREALSQGAATIISRPDGIQEASGTFSLLHGYSGERPSFVSGYTGKRNYPGSVFGDNERIYLDGDGKWTARESDLMGFSVEKVASAEVTFRRALVVTPETLQAIARKMGRTDFPEVPMRDGRSIGEYDADRDPFEADLFDGEGLAKWAEAEGYDGLVVTGFDRAAESAPRKMDRTERGEEIDITADAMVEGMGFRGDVGQDQVVAFRADAVRLGDDVPAGTPVDVSSQIIPQADPIMVDMGDGQGERSALSVLDELDADRDFATIAGLCGGRAE